MSDSSQRRGTYGSPRGVGADGGRSRDSEDPLAELARLVSQSDPRSHATSGEARPGYAPVPPRAAYTPPAVDRVQDRLDPLGYRSEPRAPAYGSTQPAYNTQNTNDDFFEDVPLRGSQNGGYAQNGSYKTYNDDFDTGYEDDFQARSYRDQFDDDDTATVYPGADDALDEEVPVRRRSGAKLMVSVLSLAVIGGLGTWGYMSLGGSDGSTASGPPVIKKDAKPDKVFAQQKAPEKSMKDPARVLPNGEAKVGPAPEEPGEKPAPRVILPGAPDATGAQSRVAEAPSAPPPQMPAVPTIPETDSNSSPNNTASIPSQPTQQNGSGPRQVRTFTIRPDGSMNAPQAETASVAQATPVAAAPEPPAPIQGTGPAEGMSLQPGPDFGIMQNAPPAPEAPSQQTAYAAENVPMPLPRPQVVRDAPPAPAAAAPQARAATPAPLPASAGGPPSSPQPQVTVTNKRALQPQGAIPAARPSQQQRSTAPAPAAAQAAPPQPARPVAVASTAPVPLSSPTPVTTQSIAPPPPRAATPAPAPAPVVAAPQVATVAGASGAFGVQLTAQRSQEEAMAAFNALKQRHPQVLGSYNATVARADLGPDRGVFYRAMVPAQNQQDAANLCIQFKSQGVDCIVQRR